jgi:hypothetical protein
VDVTDIRSKRRIKLDFLMIFDRWVFVPWLNRTSPHIVSPVDGGKDLSVARNFLSVEESSVLSPGLAVLLLDRKHAAQMPEGAQQYPQRQLFGGAIVSNIFQSYHDLSDLRPVSLVSSQNRLIEQ